jgi:retron-type reverse transcriptase
MLRVLLIIIAIIVLVKLCSNPCENKCVSIDKENIQQLSKESIEVGKSIVNTIKNTKVNGTPIKEKFNNDKENKSPLTKGNVNSLQKENL